MRRESSPANDALLDRFQAIRALLGECEKLLSGSPTKAAARKVAMTTTVKSAAHSAFDFTIPVRPFIKKYSRGMSGPKKFTLLVAHLTAGDVSKTVSLDEIMSQWNRMKAKGLLGMKFNRFYSSVARDNDWVATRKNGLYHLRPSWKDIFK